mmetsp:Transcript_97405/g.247684  ORF Transcript_97405/g.247684 Transcript_97405/m.247684 type:complete len:149 (-) Transcript_97405:266-712(-)
MGAAQQPCCCCEFEDEVVLESDVAEFLNGAAVGTETAGEKSAEEACAGWDGKAEAVPEAKSGILGSVTAKSIQEAAEARAQERRQSSLKTIDPNMLPGGKRCGTAAEGAVRAVKEEDSDTASDWEFDKRIWSECGPAQYESSESIVSV